jgi:phage baseplate assembly protein gpV
MTNAAAEADRRIGAMLQTGTVVAVDNAMSAVRVQLGDLKTGWLKVAQITSGTMKMHFMPSVGERVSVAAPSGDLAQGFVLGALPIDANGIAPGADQPTMDLGGGMLRVIGNLYVDGNITVTGDVVASGVSLVSHTHGGVVPGGASTAVPN